MIPVWVDIRHDREETPLSRDSSCAEQTPDLSGDMCPQGTSSTIAAAAMPPAYTNWQTWQTILLAMCLAFDSRLFCPYFTVGAMGPAHPGRAQTRTAEGWQ